MNKNNLLTHKLLSKTNIAVFCAVGMIAGFLLSRAWLSFFTFAFGVNALWNVHPKRWFENKWWLIGVGWIAMYALSYFWTMNTSNWSTRFEVKAPILLLPLAFAFTPAFSKKQLHFFTNMAALFFVASAVYSLSFFIKDAAYYSEQYTFSHVLPTLVYGDHIRYSLAITLFSIWCVYSLKDIDNKWMKAWVIVTIVFLSIYLHILAARTGLITWYLFVIMWSMRYAFKKSLIVGGGIIALLAIMSFAAMKYVPTLEKRVWYFKHTFELYRSGNISSSYSDMGRIISYDIAARLMVAAPFTGTGSGDMLFEMNRGYDTWYPDVPEEYRLLPHNQFLVVCLGCGFIALALFIAWVFMPIVWFRKTPGGFYLFSIWFSLLLALLVEPMLEVQFGVFVYLFFLLWQKHALVPRRETNIA